MRGLNIYAYLHFIKSYLLLGVLKPDTLQFVQMCPVLVRPIHYIHTASFKNEPLDNCPVCPAMHFAKRQIINNVALCNHPVSLVMKGEKA